MATLINKDGTNSADNLTYNKGGAGVVYHTGAGSDKVNITGGAVAVVNDSGNVTFNVTGGGGHTITGSTNSDTLNINGANIVDANLDSGRDYVTIKNSSGRKAKGALSVIRGGDWTDTFTIEAGADNYQLYGDAGNDIFEVKGGNNIILWGGAANDVFTVTGGIGIKLRGGDSADEYHISTDAVDMQLGYGNDIVNVTAGNNQIIKANLGINTINLMAGSGHMIVSDIDQAASKKQGYTDAQIKNGEGIGYGVDKVYISGTATQVTGNLGDGKDVVEVSTGSNHRIFTEGWGDSITISGTTSKSIFDAGAGDDTITISGGNDNMVYGGEGRDEFRISGGQSVNAEGGNGDDSFIISGGTGVFVEGGSGNDIYNIQWGDINNNLDDQLAHAEIITIDNRSAGFEDKDELVLSQVNSEDFNYSILDGTLVMTDVMTGKKIKILGWDEAEAMRYTFADTTLDLAGVEALSHVLHVARTGSYEVGSVDKVKLVKDMDQVELTQVDKPITIEGIGLPMGNYGVGYDHTAEGVVIKLHDLDQGNMQVIKTFTVKGTRADQVNLTLPGNRGLTTIALSDLATDNNIWNLAERKYVDFYVDLGDTSGTSGNPYVFKGGMGNDVVTSQGGSHVQIVEKAGNNTISVKDGTAIGIETGAGNDTITLSGGNDNTAYGGDGRDEFRISGGQDINAYGGNGFDIYRISGGQNINAYGGNDDDTFIISGGTGVLLEGGAGNDIYNIQWGKLNDNPDGQSAPAEIITIDNRSANFNDKDELFLAQANSEDFNFSILEGTLVMTDIMTGKKLKVIGWDEAEDMKYSFNDTTLDLTGVEELSHVLKVVKTGSYEVGSVDKVKLVKDMDQVELTQVDKPIAIDGIGLPVGNYGVGYDRTDEGVVIKLHDLDQKNLPVVKTFTIKGTSADQVSLTLPVNGNMTTIAISGLATDNNIWSLAESKYVDLYVDLGDTSGTAGTPYVFKGGLGNDVVLSEGGSNVQITDLTGNNTISVKDGTAIGIDTGVGNDTIELTGATDITINAGEGNDTISVTGGSGNIIDAGAGNDQITFHGILGGTVNGVEGENTLIINFGENNTINGGKDADTITALWTESTEFNGGSGNDTISLEAGNNNIVNGGEGDDTITLGGGSSSTVNGGAGNDHITVSGTGHMVNGTEGENTLIVNYGSNNTINGGKDADTITALGSETTEFNGGAGNDTISLEGGNDNIINGGAGNDTITLLNSTGNIVNGVEGENTLIINFGENNTINGGTGNDTISVKAGNGHTLYGGAGNDTYSFSALQDNASFVIDNSGNQQENRDILLFQDCNRNELECELDGDTLTITHVNYQTKIVINNFKAEEFEYIQFRDGKISAEEFITPNKTLIIEDGLSHGDVGFVEKKANPATGYEVILKAGTVGDIKTVSIENGDARENQATIEGGNATGVIYGGYSAQKGDAVNNTVTVTGGQVKDLYGGYSENGVVSQNLVTLSGGIVEGNVYGGGGLDSASTVHDNEIVIKGAALVKGNVYNSFGGTLISTQEGGTITISDQAVVEGTIMGSAGIDRINVTGGAVNSISTMDGDDIVSITGGAVQELSTGAGDDTITIASTINKVEAGTGNDIITVDLAKSGSFTIDNTTADAADRDQLVLQGKASTDFNYAIEEDTLVITEILTGHKLTVLGWNKAEAMEYTFTNETIGLQELEVYSHILRVAQNGSYQVGQADRVLLTQALDQVELTGVNKALVIEDTSLPAGNYGIGYDKLADGVIVKLYDLDQENNPVVKSFTVKGSSADQVSLMVPVGGNLTQVALPTPATNGNIWDIAQEKYVGWKVDLGAASGPNINAPYTFEGGLGDDIITSQGGNFQYILDKTGNNTILVKGSSYVDISTGDGNDTIKLDQVNSSYVYTHAGDDTIIINGGYGIINAGPGNDTYIFNELDTDQYYVINFKDKAEEDRDHLELASYGQDDFEYTCLNDIANRLITHKNGNRIHLEDWKEQNLETISFQDGEVLTDSLFKKMVINDGRNHGDLTFKQGEELYNYSVVLEKGTLGRVKVVNVENGTAYGNTLELKNNTQAGVISGAYGKDSQVISNTVTLAGSQTNLVFGGCAEGDGSQANYNTVTMMGGTSGSLTGGDAMGADGQANHNTVHVSQNAIVSGDVRGGYAAKGSAEENTVIISGGSIITGDVYSSEDLSASGTNPTYSGSVYIYDGSEVKKSVYADNVEVNNSTVVHIYGKKINASDGTITKIDTYDENSEVIVRNSNLRNGIFAKGGNDIIQVYGSKLTQIDGGAGDDNILVKDTTITAIAGGDGDDNIVAQNINPDGGCWLNGGDGDDNIVAQNINPGSTCYLNGGNGSDTYTIKGIQAGNIFNVSPYSSYAAGEVEKLYLQDYKQEEFLGTLNNVMLTLYHKTTGAKINLNSWYSYTNDNEIIFADSIIKDSSYFDNSKTKVINNSIDNGSVFFKNVSSGNVDGYSLILEKGTVYDFTCAGVTEGTGSNNAVIIYGGTIQNNVFGTYGYTSSSGIKANINNTTVTVLGGEIGGHIRIADATNGKSTNNTIAIGGTAVVQGSIYQSRGSANTTTDNMGTITIQDTAQIKGSVYGGVGKDTVTIAGNAKVANVSLGTGNDTFILKDNASVDNLEMGSGNNTIYLYGGSLGSKTLGSEACEIHFGGMNNVTFTMQDQQDKIYVEAGKNIKVNGGNGNDIIYVSGGEDVNVSGGVGNDYVNNEPTGSYYNRGSDTFYISGGTRVFADGGSQDDTFTISGGKDITAEGGLGNDTFYIKGGQDITVSGGIGNDYVDNNANGSAYYYRGSDTFYISGGTRVFVDGGTNDDIFTISGGKDITAEGGVGNDTFYIKNGQDITVSGGIGNDFVNNDTTSSYYHRGSDTFYISGGTGVFADGGSDDDNFIISGGKDITADGGMGNDTFYISGGDLVSLIGGSGNDTYKFTGLQMGGQYTVDLKYINSSYTDLLDFSAFNKEDFVTTTKGSDVILTHTNGAQVTIKGWLGNRNNANIKFADGQLLDKEYFVSGAPEASVATQADVIKSFMTGLSYSHQSGVAALDEAVVFSSAGRFTSFNSLLNEFKSTINSCNINSFSDADRFYQQYCGIILDNADTGAITGADCGGPVVKTADSVVEEDPSITLSDFVLDRSNRITAYDYDKEKMAEFYATEINGLTLYWDDSDWESLAGSHGIDIKYLEQMMAGTIKAWTEPSVNLIRESYGMSLTDACSELQTLADGTRGLQVKFDYFTDKNWLAYVSNTRDANNVYEKMVINLRYYTTGVQDVNGYTNQGNLDRTIAHELVHGTMAANIKDFSTLPCYIKEGLAELVHGIDDERNYTLNKWMQDYKYSMDDLFDVSHTKTRSGDSEYAGGYTLLRYFAKQVYDYANSGSAMLADSFTEATQGFEELMSAAMSFDDTGALATATDSAWDQEEQGKLQLAYNPL